MKRKKIIETELTPIITDKDVTFVKQVPLYERDRLKIKKIKKERNDLDKLRFPKQIPLHPRERMKRKRKLENYDNLI